ncbi:MAG: hypothetical protein AAB964_02125 [Patescibacteria group bacterium]
MSRIAPASVTGPVRSLTGSIFKIAAWVGVAIIAATIFLLVPLVWLLGSDSDTPTEQYARPRLPIERRAQLEDPQCTRVWQGRDIGPVPTSINEEGACIWRIKSAGACFKGRRAAWTTDTQEYTICDKGPGTYTQTVDDLETLWTSDGTVVRVSLLLMPDPAKQQLSVAGGIRKALIGR